MIYSIHLMMAGATKIDQLKLTEQESKTLAKAIQDVNQHYNVGIDPKVMAWVGLVTTCVAIYAPRLAMYKMSNTFKKDKKAQGTKVQSIVPLNPTEQIPEAMPLSNV